MHKDFDLSRHRLAVAEKFSTVLRKELREVTAKIINLESEKATLRKELKPSSLNHAEVGTGLVKDLGLA